jgi:hypothetical protein
MLKIVNRYPAVACLALAVCLVVSLGVWFAKRHVDVIPAADVAVREVPVFEVNREKRADKLPNALDELATLTPIPEPEPELPPLDINIETLQPADISPAIEVPAVPEPRVERKIKRKVAAKPKSLLQRDCESIFGFQALVCMVD